MLAFEPREEDHAAASASELGLECYDAALARGPDVLIDERTATARELFADALETAPLWSRLRDGVARLFAPYL